MKVQCPNCDREIELVGPKELREEYGIGPNSVAHARKRGAFPKPWLALNNRLIFLRQDVQRYAEARSRKRVEASVGDIIKAMANLPAQERKEAEKMLEESLGLRAGTRRRRAS